MAEFDLKAFRENSLHMTQAEFATFIGKTQDAVSRMEKKSDQLPLDVLMLIAEKTGASRLTMILAGAAVSSVFSAITDAVVTYVNADAG